VLRVVEVYQDNLLLVGFYNSVLILRRLVEHVYFAGDSSVSDEVERSRVGHSTDGAALALGSIFLLQLDVVPNRIIDLDRIKNLHVSRKRREDKSTSAVVVDRSYLFFWPEPAVAFDNFKFKLRIKDVSHNLAFLEVLALSTHHQ